MTTEMSYTRNDQSAAKIGGSARINATGGYEGVITRAEAIKKPSGAVGIEIDFKTSDGATALFMDVYTQNGQGEELSGRRIIDALMLCLRVKNMTPTRATVDKWSNGGMVKASANVFTELMGKPIGLVLQKEHSTYQGQAKERMMIYACYDIASRKTPKEIVERAAKATALDAILATVKDRYEKPKGNQAANSSGTANMGASGFDALDEDIPF